jgi:hypothetical protein
MEFSLIHTVIVKAKCLFCYILLSSNKKKRLIKRRKSNVGMLSEGDMSRKGKIICHLKESKILINDFTYI